MDQQSVAWPEPGPLEEVVQYYEHSSNSDQSPYEIRPLGTAAYPAADGGTPPEKGIQHHAGGKRYHKMPAGISTVCDESVRKLAEAVHQPSQCEDNTETGILDAIFRTQHGHRERKVLPHEIEHRVADHRADDDLPLPEIETPFGLHH